MDINIKAASILAIILEGILYGISTFLFGITLWALTYQRKLSDVARPMMAAACLLFLMGTMHIIFDAYHVWQGFISSEDAEQFFGDYSKITFKNTLNELETLFGDAILIYRCYVVWQRKGVIVIPIIGWVVVAITGTHSVWSLSKLTPTNTDVVFLQETTEWVIAFYVMAFVANLVATSTLALKLWLVHRRSSRMFMTRSHVYPILRIIVESGALYSVSLVTMLAVYPSATNGAFVLTDMIAQIIPITFFLIIVRTTMLRFNDRTGQWMSTRTEVPDITTRPYITRMTDINFDKELGSFSAHGGAVEDTYRSNYAASPHKQNHGLGVLKDSANNL